MGYPDTVLDPYTANDSSARMEPGTRFHFAGKEFVYAECEDLAWAAGSVCEWADTSMTEASPDRSGGTAISGVPAGVALCAVTEGNYGCLLVKGFHSAVKTDGSVGAAGAIAIGSTDHDAVEYGDVISSAGTQSEAGKIIGWALSADTSAETVPAVINL